MIKYTCGYKYQLFSDYRIELPEPFCAHTFSARFFALEGGVLTIRTGYAWNGASGPTWDDKSNMRGSLVHDALYQAIIEGHLPRTLRAEADALLHAMCVEDGMNSIRAGVWLWAVRRHGLTPSIRNKDIFVAP
jgi:hypothetical protein